MKKKLLFLISIFLSCFLFTGCFNYKDINDVLFVTAMVYDQESEDEIILYTEVFKPTRTTGRGSERGQRLTFMGRGKTVFEIIRDLSLTSSKRFNYTQNKVIIITERAARRGLKKFIDLSRRDQEFLVRPYICIYSGNPQELLRVNYQEEEYVGMFIFDLINNIWAASRAIKFDFNDYLNIRYNAEDTNVLTFLKPDLDQGRAAIKIDGGAIVQNEKMTGVLTKGQSQSYNFIMDKIESGTLEVTNPQEKSSFISLEILKSKTKTQITYDGESIKFKKIINVDVTIAESQDNLVISKQNISDIEKYANYNIKTYCTNLFEEYKAENIDIFNFTDQFHNKYPSMRKELKNTIQISNIEVESHVKVKSFGKYSDFR